MKKKKTKIKHKKPLYGTVVWFCARPVEAGDQEAVALITAEIQDLIFEMAGSNGGKMPQFGSKKDWFRMMFGDDPDRN
jgi:hypothetical protein